jgi:hypothetical protein
MSQNNRNEQFSCRVKRSAVWIESTYRFIINEDTGKPEIVAVSGAYYEKRKLWKLEKRKCNSLGKSFSLMPTG